MDFELIGHTPTVTHSLDKSTGLYTFSLLERGGPVIVSKNFEEGKEEMIKALSFAMSVRNLQYFDDISLKNRAQFSRTNAHGKPKINYIELVSA